MRKQDGEGQLNGQANGNSPNVAFLAKDLEKDIESMVDMKLTCPNMDTVEKQRKERTRSAMEAINPSLAHSLLPKVLSPTEKAAINIQRVFRGYLGRKIYLDKLYEKYEMEEAEMEAKRRQQVYEGEILVDNLKERNEAQKLREKLSYHLEQELDEKETLRRNRARSADSHATTIQRAWKAYQRRLEGIEVPKDPVYIGRAEDGYNEEEFPFLKQKSKYHMHEHDHASPRGIDLYDIFNDSLEADDDENADSGRSESPDIARSFPGDYLVEDEFSGTFESMDLNFSRFKISQDLEYIRYRDSISASLPEPTTDWDTIESVLTNESGVNSPEEDDQGEQDKDLTRKFSSGPNLQLCFVDDAVESDTESDPEVRVYIVDDDRNMDYLVKKNKLGSSDELCDEREIDSRDSGCVPGDIADVNIDYVTDYTPNQLQHVPLPAEESKRVLFSLQLHEEHEEHQKEHDEVKKRESVAPNSITLKSFEELTLLKNEIENKVQVISNELVECLMQRDSLHAEQESLLMEVEDLTKLAQGRQRLQQSKNSSKIKVTE